MNEDASRAPASATVVWFARLGTFWAKFERKRTSPLPAKMFLQYLIFAKYYVKCNYFVACALQAMATTGVSN